MTQGPPCNGAPAGVAVRAGWAYIPAGQFTMGLSVEEDAALQALYGVDDFFGNLFAHQVTLTRPFIAKITEVTVEEFEISMGVDGVTGNRNPVINVNWFDAAAYANALSRTNGLTPCYALEDCAPVVDGRGRIDCPDGVEIGRQILDCDGYRLPTEAEWEYMARAGTTTRYHLGNDAYANRCSGWHNADLIDCASNPAPNCDNVFLPVEQRLVGLSTPNAYGLFDMHGNVAEWVLDRYTFFEDTPRQDPAVLTEDCGVQAPCVPLIRGGSHRDRYQAMSFYRVPVGTQDLRDRWTGFRVIRTVR